MNDFQAKLDIILSVLKQTVYGSCAIALAGAHAKGTADISSDLDIYLFAECFLPADQRHTLIRTISDPDKPIYISNNADGRPWGGSMDFYFDGIPVEINIRTFALVDKIVNDSLSGKFEIVPATWTSNGYYTYVYLSELNFIVPVWDPNGYLSMRKALVVTYPEPLRNAIIRRFMDRAETWLDNFHYNTAIERCDLLFIAPIILHTVLDMVQVVFALNRTYFNGDKKLEKALNAMPLCPQFLKTKLSFLLTAAHDRTVLSNQRDILRSIRDELKILIQQNG